MNALIALGIFAGLLIAVGIMFGWIALVDRLADRFEWPLWLNGGIGFAPFAVGLYFVILLKISSQ